MKTYVVLALAFAACAGNGTLDFASQLDSTRAFVPTTIDLTRVPPGCSTDDPPFEADDVYTIALYGSAAYPGHPTVISVTFHASLPIGEDIPVALQPFGLLLQEDPLGIVEDFYGQNGTLPGSGNTFYWQQGNDASELDDQPITNASVTIDALPAAEGEYGTFTIRLVFADAGIYDAKVGAPVSSVYGPCGGVGGG